MTPHRTKLLGPDAVLVTRRAERTRRWIGEAKKTRQWSKKVRKHDGGAKKRKRWKKH